MRFANPAEATGGFVGQTLGALMICIWRVLRGPLQGPWWSFGGPWGILGSY